VNGCFVGGTDHNNQPLFVARIQFEGSVQPGKFGSHLSDIIFSYGGREICGNTSFEVLEMNDTLSWQYCNDSNDIPVLAVQTGNEADGKPIYSARADINGTKQVGKAGRHFTGASIPYGGKENFILPFEILVYRF